MALNLNWSFALVTRGKRLKVFTTRYTDAISSRLIIFSTFENIILRYIFLQSGPTDGRYIEAAFRNSPIPPSVDQVGTGNIGSSKLLTRTGEMPTADNLGYFYTG